MDDIEKDVKFSRSRKPYILIYFMILFLFILTIYVKSTGMPLNSFTLIGTIIFAIISIGLTEIHRIKDTYKISGHYVGHRSGYLAKTEKKIHLKSITDINASQGLWQRLVKYGSIMVQSASGANHIYVKNINHPEKFLAELENKMKQIEDQL